MSTCFSSLSIHSACRRLRRRRRRAPFYFQRRRTWVMHLIERSFLRFRSLPLVLSVRGHLCFRNDRRDRYSAERNCWKAIFGSRCHLPVPGVISSSLLRDRLNQELVGRAIRCSSSLMVNRIVANQLSREQKTNANIGLDQAEKQTCSNRLMLLVCFDQRLAYLYAFYSLSLSKCFT